MGSPRTMPNPITVTKPAASNPEVPRAAPSKMLLKGAPSPGGAPIRSKQPQVPEEGNNCPPAEQPAGTGQGPQTAVHNGESLKLPTVRDPRIPLRDDDVDLEDSPEPEELGPDGKKLPGDPSTPRKNTSRKKKTDQQSISKGSVEPKDSPGQNLADSKAPEKNKKTAVATKGTPPRKKKESEDNKLAEIRRRNKLAHAAVAAGGILAVVCLVLFILVVGHRLMGLRFWDALTRVD